MGRSCRICRRAKPNEQFGGKGMRAVVCAKCRRRPKEELERIFATDEIYGFLLQKNISAKNIKRIAELAKLDNSRFQELRSLVLEIANVHPRKRRRWKVIPQQHPGLFKRVVESEFFDHLLDTFCLPAPYEESIIEGHECLLGVWLENREP